MLLSGRPFHSYEFLQNIGPILAAVLAGAFLTPILLPWVPLRAFAAKGALVGALSAVYAYFLEHRDRFGANAGRARAARPDLRARRGQRTGVCQTDTSCAYSYF